VTEAERKRRAALEAAGGAPLVVSAPENVGWLLCGRGRPVDAEILTRTPELPELETAGPPRPAIAEL
jgi:hypothetical protein